MRAALSRFVPTLALSLAACAPGTVVYVPAPRPTPVYEPPPAHDPIEPLEITIGHPVRGRLLVQTNRPAYVALFEVVPEVGIRLVHPSSSRESRFVLSGLSSVPIWWSPTRPGASRARTVASSSTRYIYAVASDEPLRLPPAAFQAGYFRRTLGSRVFHSASPYTTMRALSRQVLPHVADEEWAEDVFIMEMEATRESRPVRVARVYCPDGTIYEVPAAMADRVLCPRNTRVVVVQRPHEQSVPPGRRVGDVPEDDRPVRPDSVIGDDNRRVPPPVKRGRGPIDRVTEPVQAGRAGRGPVGDGPPREHPGGGNANGRDEGNANGRDNGNANGRDNGNANGRENGNANGRANGHAAEPTPPRAVPAVPGTPANTPARPGDAAPGRNDARPGTPASASGAEREDRPAAAPSATKDSVKAEGRPEAKPETKPEAEPKAESKADAKADAKEQKGPRRDGAEEADSVEPAEQPDSSSAKPASRKPKPNSNRPPRG